MKTNDIKKGDMFLLRNGWKACMADNMKGDQMATVYGDYTEMGSVYSHDIVGMIDEMGFLIEVEHTPNQIKLRKMVEQEYARLGM